MDGTAFDRHGECAGSCGRRFTRRAAAMNCGINSDDLCRNCARVFDGHAHRCGAMPPQKEVSDE